MMKTDETVVDTDSLRSVKDTLFFLCLGKCPSTCISFWLMDFLMELYWNTADKEIPLIFSHNALLHYQ